MRRPKKGTIAAPIALGKTGVLDDLAVFVLVARHASFVEVSRRTAMPTSTVSRAVARLEDELGVRLLQRTTRKVAVTEEGRDLLRRAGDHLEALHEALGAASDARAEPSGPIRVTAPAFTGATRVAQALAGFARRHPQVAIELDPSNAIRDLVEDGYDFGIRVGPLADADFVTRPLWTGRMGLFGARGFVRAVVGARGVVSREQLEREPCVVLRAGAAWRFLDRQGHPVTISPRLRFAVNDPRAAVEVARQGLGFVLAPLEAVAAGGDGLVAVETDFGAPAPVELYLVYPSRRLLPRRVRMAIDWLTAPRHTAT